MHWQNVGTRQVVFSFAYHITVTAKPEVVNPFNGMPGSLFKCEEAVLNTNRIYNRARAETTTYYNSTISFFLEDNER